MRLARHRQGFRRRERRTARARAPSRSFDSRRRSNRRVSPTPRRAPRRAIRSREMRCVSCRKARQASLRPRRSGLFGARRFARQSQHVRAHILRPSTRELGKLLVVGGEQRARRFLEVWKVAGHRPHDTRKGGAHSAGFLRTRLPLSCFVNEATQRGRDSVRLFLEPLPMARQERNLATDDAELGAPRPVATRGRFSLEHLSETAAQIKVDLPTSVIVEYEGTLYDTVVVMLE